MRNLTLRQLRYVDALARHGHFGRAAEACAISQPALSVQIRDLEAALGVPLFERGGRAVRPTGFGAAFAERAAAILRSVDELGDLARFSRAGLGGVLRLGVIPTVAPYLLPRLLPRISEAHPDLDLSVRETVTPRLVGELGEGALDAAIVALPISNPGFTEVALFEERMVLVRPISAAPHPVPAPEDLARERLLLLEEGHCFRDHALAFCGAGAPGARDGLDGTSLSTLVQMVGAGIGITLVPEMAVPVETRSAPVAVCRFRGREPGRTVGMIWRRTTPLADRFRDLAGLVKDAGEQARDSGRGDGAER